MQGIEPAVTSEPAACRAGQMPEGFADVWHLRHLE
ncbi:hypothetical protein EV589_1092 [Mycobacterium sp. BK558]|nr:hypothetical protein EV589_1092 [Mycobacterium sp. BK558]